MKLTVLWRQRRHYKSAILKSIRLKIVSWRQKKVLKWVQGELLKAMKADCEVHPKKEENQIQYTWWENEGVKVISRVMDACWRWNIEAVHLVFLKIKSTSSMRVIEKHGWEVWIYGSRNHNPGQQINFYRTQVSLGSGLWVPASLTTYIQDLCETLLMWLWLMMKPTQY